MAKRKKSDDRGRPPKKQSGDFVGKIGARIRKLRNKAGLSVADAADAAQTAAPTWYHWEAGRHLPLERLPDIAKALKCQPKDLLPS